jgi:MFS family permease
LGATLRVLAGRWSDGRNRRPFVIAGYAIPALSRVAIALAAVPWQVLAARLFDRTGKGIRSAPRDALLAEAVAPEDRGRAFGVNRSLDHLGAAVGPLIASGCLAAGLSLSQTFGVAAAVGVIAPLLLLLRLVDPKPNPARTTSRSSPSADEHPGLGPIAPPQVPAGDDEIGSVPERGDRQPDLAFRRWLRLAGLFALANASDAFVLLRARELGWSTAALPLLWLGHHLVKSAATATGGALCGRFGVTRLLTLGWFSYAAIAFGFASAQRSWHLLPLLFVYGLYFGLVEAPVRTLVAELAAEPRRGRAFGLYHGVVGIGALPASVLTGWLWDRWGSPVAFSVAGGLSAIAALLLVQLSPALERGRKLAGRTARESSREATRHD